MEDSEQGERDKNKYWIALGYVTLVIGILISVYICESVEDHYLGIITLGVFAFFVALLMDKGNYYDDHKKAIIPGVHEQLPEQTQGDVPIEEELFEEVDVKCEKTEIIVAVICISIMIIFSLFFLTHLNLLRIGPPPDDAPTLEVTDWDIDVHPRKFLMMEDNGSWSYEYEFNFDVWVYSESNSGGYPNTWIGIYYVVNNKTIERKYIHISESEHGSADHHQERLITNYRVTDGDDVKIILEFPRYGFGWVDDSDDVTRYSWIIIYDVDVGREEGDS